ncbi:MAG: hypothetical protein MJ252_02120 [archaeon]|nr:hypothetical protein [archaeon]
MSLCSEKKNSSISSNSSNSEEEKERSNESQKDDFVILIDADNSSKSNSKGEKGKKLRGIPIIKENISENNNENENAPYLLRRKKRRPGDSFYVYCHHCGYPYNNDYLKCSQPGCKKIFCFKCIRNYYVSIINININQYHFYFYFRKYMGIIHLQLKSK